MQKKKKKEEEEKKNPMDRGAWWATVHGVAKGRTGLSMCTMNPYDSLASVALIGVNIPSERLFLQLPLFVLRIFQFSLCSFLYSLILKGRKSPGN